MFEWVADWLVREGEFGRVRQWWGTTEEHNSKEVIFQNTKTPSRAERAKKNNTESMMISIKRDDQNRRVNNEIT